MNLPYIRIAWIFLEAYVWDWCVTICKNVLVLVAKVGAVETGMVTVIDSRGTTHTIYSRQCDVVCCSVLRCVAVRRSVSTVMVMDMVSDCRGATREINGRQCDVVRCSVLQSIAVWCSVDTVSDCRGATYEINGRQCDVVRCSVLQIVAVLCSVDTVSDCREAFHTINGQHATRNMRPQLMRIWREISAKHLHWSYCAL